MPLFSDHISNMYYSGSPSYTSSPYSYSSAVPPYGSSYSASYLNPGGNYSSHSSFGGYSRAPLGSRWLTSGGRAYSPILSSISEKGTTSPVRINSPRRIPISSRTYVSSPYSSRPININTADIDVSRDKYRSKVQSSSSSTPTGLPPRRESPLINKENGHDKPDTGIDTSPGPKRSTIKRDRTVVRLHTVKRKERDSPRKPVEVLNNSITYDPSKTEYVENQTESKKWREKLADDLAYKTQKEKKTLGAKLVEKFTLKDKNEDEYDSSFKKSPINNIDKEKSPVEQNSTDEINLKNKSFDRRCSMELLAEQASLLDSLIRRENLSTAPLDISKIGSIDKLNIDIKLEPEHGDRTNIDRQQNRLSTTKSDHSLHDRLSSKDIKELPYSKRKSLRKCSSGSNIRKLDCIKEIPKKTTTFKVPPLEDDSLNKNKKLKPKMKTKITSTVEVTPTTSPLKFIVENVTVEENVKPLKKDIIYSSALDQTQTLNTSLTKIDDKTNKNEKLKKQLKPHVEIEIESGFKEIEHNADKDKSSFNENTPILKGHRKSIKSKIKDTSKPQSDTSTNISSPDPDDGNFWEKLGKRETVYLMKRKQNLEEAREKSKRSLFWFPEEEALNIDEDNIENTDPESNKVCAGIINEKNKSIEILGDKHEQISGSQENVNNNVPDNTLLDQNENSITVNNENMLNKGSTISNIKIPSVNESDKVESCCELEDSLNTKLTETRAESKNLLNISEKLAENSKHLNKSKDNKKNSVGDKDKENYDKLNQDQETQLKETNPKSKMLLNNSEKPAEDTNSINKTKDNVAENNKENDSKLKDIHQESELKQTETSTQCENILSKTEKLAEDTKTINKTKENVNERKKDLNENKLIKSNLHNAQHFSYEKESNYSSSNIKCNVIEGETNDNEKLSAKTKNDQKEEINNISKVSSKNKNDILSIEENSPEISNIPNTEDHESFNNKSTEINTDNIVLKIDEIKAEKQVAKPTSTNSQKEEIINNVNKTSNSNNKNETEVAITHENIELNIINEEDNKTRQESEYTNSRINSAKDKSETGAVKVETKPSIEIINETVSTAEYHKVFTPTKPVKEEKALKTLIATPRPLQKRNPQSIRSSSSSSSESSDEDSSDEDEKEEKGDDESSQGEGENNTDGRISTGSNDSGFDSSAPTSPSGFLHAKKDCDVNCHRKCEKLTANLCGVNQRLLVEALASRTTSKRGGDSPSTSAGITPPQTFTHDILEQELELSTAYDLFRKTGRFTPPARSIPRFRKYTIEDFQFIRVLGKGSFGKVMLAELRDTEYYYAVKCLKKDVVLEDDDVECTLIERKVLALGTNHPYLCHLFATFQTDSHLFFVMEYLNGGDLMFHIQQSGRFPEVKARFYAAEIVSGLKFLHKRGIVYRDLKLDNILLDFDGHVRIADFGMCKLQIYLDKTADTFCGTPDYMAPEIIRGLKYNQTVDWWSFGVLLYEMLIGQSPFSGCDEDELFWSICNEMPSYPRFLSPESLSILTRLLDKDARTRLGGPECMHGDIRDQKFFEQIHWDRLERRELEAPFKPRVRHPMDTQYFDRAFTGERPRLTAVEPQVLRSMDQEPFRGFSYTNPNATDR